MVQAKPKLKTFDDYLAHCKDTEARYELTNGELIEIPHGSDENVIIARAMDLALSDLVGFRRVRSHQLAIEMPGQPKNRFPDITVLLPEHLEQLKTSGQSAIRLDMHPPMLVVEVVSPGPENHRRDYIEKRNQYEWRGIPEYWIVDPENQRVTVLFLTADGYEASVFMDNTVVVSKTFPDWTLTAADMLST
ncbi:Uma2 family endonuclease [Leptothoe kymatousa]|uniref:Uma2 family endonuclease n=1 Tax=Leptothoe kymatousa TAU-MAC 1615 TaxID=2364775 RepID=A0ABS5Y0T3_9CYAN|nr:Uma2 family endonuclease [Leptothoe kymatousa]MBT9311442.1 Uma2 family endonuclease [Leptothoe kymatousa TAU-MAC 1615]